MPKIKLGGNKAKRAKGNELIFKEYGEEYGQVHRMLGNGRCEVTCSDGTKRLCHIRGKMRNKVWVCQGDIVLVSLRHFHFQDEKGEIIVKYTSDEARKLKTYGELPDNEADFVDGELSDDQVSHRVSSKHRKPRDSAVPRSMRPNWEAKPASPKPPQHHEGSGELRQMDPSLVRFSQATISPVFRNGGPIESSIVSIMRGQLDFADINMIYCTELDGKVYSLDNRRLYVARVLQTMGVIESVWVVFVPFDDPVVQCVVDGQTIWKKKFTTSNCGQWVKVNGHYFSKDRGEWVSCPVSYRNFHVKRTKPQVRLRFPKWGKTLFFGSELLNEDLSERL
jgi:translation initiation factor 1A